jgi:membrane-associated phospholipid phosphatase
MSVKFVVSSAVSAAILLYDSPILFYYVIVGVINGFISKILKAILKHPRPLSSPKPGYGMPSSHAQSMAYFTMSLLLEQDGSYLMIFAVFLMSLYSYLSRYCKQNPSSLLIYLFAAVCDYFALFYEQSKWRIDSRRHSVSQTIVGSVLGIIMALFAACLKRSIFSCSPSYCLAEVCPTFTIRATAASLGFIYLNRESICSYIIGTKS